MKKYLLAVLAGLLLLGCAQPQPAPSPTPAPTLAPAATAAPIPSPAPAASAEELAEIESAPDGLDEALAELEELG